MYINQILQTKIYNLYFNVQTVTNNMTLTYSAVKYNKMYTKINIALLSTLL